MSVVAACFSVGAAAVGTKWLMRVITSPRAFYKGGFGQVMTKREAQLILGVRGRALSDSEKIKQAYKKVMFANHPDSGGSPYIALKINEAKDLLLRKTTAF